MLHSLIVDEANCKYCHWIPGNASMKLKCGLCHSLSLSASASAHCTAVESHVFSFRYGNLKGFPRVHSLSEWMIWARSGYQTGGDQIEALHWLPQRRCHTVDMVKVGTQSGWLALSQVQRSRDERWTNIKLPTWQFSPLSLSCGSLWWYMPSPPPQARPAWPTKPTTRESCVEKKRTRAEETFSTLTSQSVLGFRQMVDTARLLRQAFF